MDVPTSPHAALELAIAKFGIKGLGGLLGRSPKSIERYRKGDSKIKPWLLAAIKGLLATQAPTSASFTFIDLFAGIGGLRLGFDRAGGKCVFTSEWNKYSRETYAANFPNDDHIIQGDITKIRPSNIPDHDVLLAGFPCQPFSLAGVSKKNSLGHDHGFKDQTQGTLFFDICQIIQAKQPKAFLLENVKNLISHNGGETFATIRGALEEELDYEISFRVIDGRAFVPQHRERIYIVGFRKDLKAKFAFDCLNLPKQGPVLNSILHKTDEEPETPYTIRKRTVTSVGTKYTLTDNLWAYLQAYAKKHAAAGNGFGYSAVGPCDVARTLSARYYKDGSEILVKQAGTNPRRLTPRECARLMGFDRPGQPIFKIPVSDTQAYKQFGNSVIVPVVEQVALLMTRYLRGENPLPEISVEEPELALALP